MYNNHNDPHNQETDHLKKENPMTMNGPRPYISVLPTPNPNALKFVFDSFVKSEGKSTYRAIEECKNNLLAQQLFTIRGVDNLHFFQNTITVTKFSYEDWEEVEAQVMQLLEEKISEHDPDYLDEDPEKNRRQNLSPELLEIEEILDRTIRPGLQGDGGDLVCVDLKDDVLLIRYEGACGTCPSSAAGTLEAIKQILQDELDKVISVYIVPAEV